MNKIITKKVYYVIPTGSLDKVIDELKKEKEAIYNKYPGTKSIKLEWNDGCAEYSDVTHILYVERPETVKEKLYRLGCNKRNEEIRNLNTKSEIRRLKIQLANLEDKDE